MDEMSGTNTAAVSVSVVVVAPWRGPPCQWSPEAVGGDGSSGTDHWWNSGTSPKKSWDASDDDRPAGEPSVLPSFPLSACPWKTEHCQVGRLATIRRICLSDVQNLAVNRGCSVIRIQKHVLGGQLSQFHQEYM